MTKHKKIAAALLIAGAAVFLRPAYAGNSEVTVKGRAAIQVLDDLNAVTYVVRYVDYVRRVADTKVIVERFVYAIETCQAPLASAVVSALASCRESPDTGIVAAAIVAVTFTLVPLVAICDICADR